MADAVPRLALRDFDHTHVDAVSKAINAVCSTRTTMFDPLTVEAVLRLARLLLETVEDSDTSGTLVEMVEAGALLMEDEGGPQFARYAACLRTLTEAPDA